MKPEQRECVNPYRERRMRRHRPPMRLTEPLVSGRQQTRSYLTVASVRQAEDNHRGAFAVFL